MGLAYSKVECIEPVLILDFPSGTVYILEQLGETMSLNLGLAPRGWDRGNSISNILIAFVQKLNLGPVHFEVRIQWT